MFNKKYQSVKQFVGKVEGGVFKRIDENRELFELLCKECPEVLSEKPWVRGWLSSQDRFLVELAEITEQDGRGHPVRHVEWHGC